MTSSGKQIVFGLSALTGICATWYFNLQFMQERGGLALDEFVEAMYASAVSSSISNDLMVVVFTFLFWSFLEARRLGMKHWWAYVVLTFSIAIAFAFPLFMLMRERKIAAPE